MNRALLATSYRNAVMNLGPVGYWPLGESSGTVAKDECGKNPGTYVAAPTLGVPGFLSGDPNTAAAFASASTQYVSVPHDPVFSFVSAFTILLHLKIASAPATQQGLVTKYVGTATGWDLNVRPTDGTLRMTVRGTSTIDDYGNVAVSDNLPHQCTLVIRLTGFDFYKDARLLKTMTGTWTPATNTGVVNFAGRNNAEPLNAAGLAHVALFPRALTQREISNLYRIGRGF